MKYSLLLFLLLIFTSLNCCFTGEMCVDKEKFLQLKQTGKEIVLEQEDLILMLKKEELSNDDRRLYGSILMRNTIFLQLVAAMYKLEIDEIDAYAVNDRKIKEIISHLTIKEE